MKVLFIASFSPIVSDVPASHAFYLDGLGLSFEKHVGDYVFSEQTAGAKHFGLWPLSEAAEACFGMREWPGDTRVPQASLELEVEDVAQAAAELAQKGLTAIHPPRTEPWGQTVARYLSPDGLLIGVCRTPWLHEGH